MKRPIITVSVTDAATGTTVHSETRGAFNAGIRASEAAVRAIARAERTIYEGTHPERVGDTYSRTWTSRSGRTVVATITKEATS